MDNYLYKNDFKDSEKRLAYLEKIEDPHTYKFISKIKLKKGSICLELGAGRGSVANHLCNIVGERGIVYAVDIDTRFLSRYSLGQLIIVNKNIEEYELNNNEFDFVHARHVLFHITKFKPILDRLFNSLKPNAWILIEESDFFTWSAVKSIKNEDIVLFNDVIKKILGLYTSKGLDIECGTTCFKQLSNYKSKELISNSRCRIIQGRSDEAKFHRITMEQLKPSILERGNIENNIFERFLNLHMDPNFYYRTRMTHSILVKKIN